MTLYTLVFIKDNKTYRYAFLSEQRRTEYITRNNITNYTSDSLSINTSE